MPCVLAEHPLSCGKRVEVPVELKRKHIQPCICKHMSEGPIQLGRVVVVKPKRPETTSYDWGV